VGSDPRYYFLTLGHYSSDVERRIMIMLMNTMTIDEKVDQRTVPERTIEFLEIMDRITQIIFEIQDLEIIDPRDAREEHFSDIYKQARYVLEAAQAAVASNLGVRFTGRRMRASRRSFQR